MTKMSIKDQFLTHLRSLLARFRRDEAGAVAVVAAILFPVVIGGMGLGAETGYWYLTQRKLQHAADMAAYAGAIRARAGDSVTLIQSAAIHIAHQNGLPMEAPEPAVNTPYNGDAASVEVRLQQTLPRLFTAIFTSEPLVLTARAVARVSDSPPYACVLALSPDAPGAVTMGGSATVSLNGCDLASNSSAPNAIDMYGSVEVAAGCVYAVGGAQGTQFLQSTSDCPSVQKLTAPLRDPYAHLAPPDLSRCNTLWEGLTVRCFSNGLALTQDLLVDNSLYIITGGEISAKSALLQATNVTFVLSGTARLSLQGNSQLNLSAPTSGPYSGVLFFGNQDTRVMNTIRGTVDSTFTGATYFPRSDVEYSGSSSTGCTRIIAYAITFTGHSGVRCTSTGGTSAVTERAVSLVE